MTTGFFVDDLVYVNAAEPPPSTPLGIECQLFDDADAAAAAGWTGNRNRDAELGTGYGFSDSNNAGGAPREMGGVVPGRTSVVSSYADTTLGGSLSQNLPLTATGRFTVTSIDGLDGGFEIGFFDAGTLDGTPAFIGARIVDGTGSSLRWWPRRDVNGSSEAGGETNQLVVGEDYLFELSYDPSGGGPGIGRLAVEFTRASDNTSLGVRSLDFTTLGTEVNLNAFGMKTLDFNANVGGQANIFLDDLKYTKIVPEPSALAIVVAGLMVSCIAVRRRRGR
ncbi:MAG: PEP-CTERM sorting domain-containing protein [Pirellulales bacterium]